MTLSLLDDSNLEDYRTLEEGVMIGRQKLAETGSVTDETLAEIIDNHSLEELGINSTRVEPEVSDGAGDRNGVDGETKH